MAPTQGRRSTTRSAVALGLVAMGALAGLGGWLATRPAGQPIAAAPGSDPRPAAPIAPHPTAPAATALDAAPSLPLLVDTEGGDSPRTAIQLAAVLGSGNTTVATRPGRLLEPATAAAASGTVGASGPSGATGPSGAVGAAAGPRLALARYDVLSAAARAPGGPAFEVIAPLYTDELVVAVRDDSNRRDLSDLAGARIDVGQPGSARSTVGEALYRSLFGGPLPRGTVTPADAGAALQHLIAGDGIDAVVLTGAQARALLPALAPNERASVRLLGWSSDRPAGRALMKSYLRATATDFGGPPVATPTSMVFLIASKPRDAAEERQLAALAGTLCARLGDLRRNGDAKWRDVTPGLQLPLPWRNDGAGATAWSRCSPGGLQASSTLPSKSNPGDRE